MHYDLVIRNGLVWSSAGSKKADIGVDDGKIVSIGDLGHRDATETFDADERWVFPGGIDTQVHFREPGNTHKEDLESGSRAAVLGGITSFFEMPNTQPLTDSEAAVEQKLGLAEGRTWANYAFYVGATRSNTPDLPALEKLPGVCGVKIFMGSSTGDLLVEDDESLLAVLKSGERRCAVHAEDEYRLRERKALVEPVAEPTEHPVWRDADVALLATRRLIDLVRQTGRPVHILHVSTADECIAIAEAKAEGLPITAEVTPQHLTMYGPDCYERLGSLAQMNPPIRDSWHQSALRAALLDGVFDIVGSDHAPHTLEEKARPYPGSPSGMPGVQTMLPVLLDLCANGFIRPEQVVNWLCERPADIFQILGKGRLVEGADADVVVVDPDRAQMVDRCMLASKCAWSPFEGETLIGWPTDVWVGGNRVVASGNIVGRPCGTPLRFGV